MKTMDDRIASFQPPGLMKMMSMHHKKHHHGYQPPQTIHDVVCQPHNVSLEQLHGVYSRTEQGSIPIPHTLHGRALTYKVPLIMKSMQLAPLAQALGPRNPGAPAHHNWQ